jgi:hypothetical protein
MANSEPTGKHGTVIAINERRDISQEREMQELVKVNREMTEKEKARTMEYLKDQEGNNRVDYKKD